MTAPESLARLADPFEPDEVKWKPQMVRQNRALVVAYVDVRAVEDRFDQVFGIDGWQDQYQVLPNGNVVGRLRVRIGDDWIEKSDVGSQSDQPDEGDRLKSAFSDALKRAAVKFGVGRYLYRLPSQWVDYDGQARQIRQTPRLPAWALPPGPGRPPHGDRARPGPTITRDQWEEIKAALLKNDTPQRTFLEHHGIEKPGELPAGRFAAAMALARLPAKSWTKAPEKAPPPETSVQDEIGALRERVQAVRSDGVKKLREDVDRARPRVGADVADELLGLLNDRVEQVLGRPAGAR